MPAERRLAAFARALRLVSAFFAIFIITAMALIGYSMSCKQFGSRRRTLLSSNQIPWIEMTRVHSDVSLLGSTDRTKPDVSGKSGDINVETTNVTIVLENLEVDYESDKAPWMYTSNNSPFVQTKNRTEAVLANTKISWNSDGRGDGRCSSGGSGKISRGYLDPYNYFLGLRNPPNISEVQVELRNLSLVDFMHINTVKHRGAWNVMGEAGDTRRYSHGTFSVISGEKELLIANDVQWVQNISYPGPVGDSQTGTFSVSGYFVAKIQTLKSDRVWMEKLDPHRTGFVLGVLMAASFGPSNCISSNSYWITIRGFPDLRKGAPESAAGSLVADGHRNGAKVGIYKGSSDEHIATARTLASIAKGVVLTAVGVVVGGAISSTVVAVLAPGLTSGPPGQGLPRLLGTAAFVAKVNEIHGFHSDAMAEFGDGLKIFIGKVEWPFAEDTASSRIAARCIHWLIGAGHGVLRNTSSQLSEIGTRQDSESSASVSDELFGGCAFYTTLIVVGFLLVHGFIWLVTRKKPLSEQIPPHAWMIYIFSIVMSHVYTAAVLNSMQYLRSHVGTGTGKSGLYLVAVLQLLLIGIGFTTFFTTILILALKRLRSSEVQWVPRENFADPDTRRSALIAGEYQGGDNTFHKLFECYYTSLSGPRVWLACLELCIVFLDAIFTALIWNEIVCLGILVCVYAVLFCTFLILSPFVDKVEGGLVLILGIVELILLVLEFMGALGDFDVAEKMEHAGIILGFVGIGLAVVIAVYCDLIPILYSLWAGLTRRFRKEVVVDGQRMNSCGSDIDSDWSGISRSLSGTGSGRGSGQRSIEIKEETIEVEGKVGYNTEKEDVRSLLTSMFGSGMIGKRSVLRRRSENTGSGSRSFRRDCAEVEGGDGEDLDVSWRENGEGYE